jgi:tetratricopeptide (TPR) repeat protein
VLRVLLWESAVAFPFGLLAPLALMCLWRRRSEPEVRALGVAALAYAGLLAVFFVSSRYRLSLALLLLPFAADQAIHLLRSRCSSRSELGALALLVAALNLPSPFTRSFAASPAERGVLEAQAWLNQGRDDRAGALARQLVERFPEDVNVLVLRAQLAIAQRSWVEAEALLQRALRLAPRTSTPRLLLAECLDSSGRPQAADRELASLLAIHPHHPLAQRRLALRYASGSDVPARTHRPGPW